MSKKESEIEFEKFIIENQSLILKVCNIFCRTQPDRDDLFQEIMIKLWKGLPSFRGESKLSTWVYRVSLNTAIARAVKRKKPNLFFPERMPETHDAKALEQTVKQNKLDILYNCINQLKPVERAIILLYLEERSYEEISEIIGISIKNVSVKLVRIRKKLKTIIQKRNSIK